MSIATCSTNVTIRIFLFLLIGSCSLLRSQTEPTVPHDTVVDADRTPRSAISRLINPLVERFVYVPDRYRSFRGAAIIESKAIVCYPIFPFVFFDSASDVIPDRYVQLQGYEQTIGFVESGIPGNVMEKYYHVLNVIGSRLRHNSSMKVGIEGTNSDQWESGETLDISSRRARAVYRYLNEVWGIPENQLLLLTPRNRPAPPSSRKYYEQYEFNRHAEILLMSDDAKTAYRNFDSKSWDLRRPLIDSTLWTSYLSPTISLLVDSTARKSIQSRAIEITRNGEVWSRSDSYVDPRFSNSLQYWKGDGESQVESEDALLKAQLVEYDLGGSAHRSPVVNIPLMYISNREAEEEFRTDRTVIVSYAFHSVDWHNEAVVEPISYRILKELICPKLKAAAIIDMISRTSSVGLMDRNQRISETCAYECSRFLMENVPSGARISENISCYGEDLPLFDNSLPEGRFFNNSVMIVVDSWVKSR